MPKPSPKSSPKAGSKKSTNGIRSVLFTFVLILCAMMLATAFIPTKHLEEVPLSDVIARANNPEGNIAKIVVTGSNLEITLKGEDLPSQTSRKDASGTLYEQGLVDHCVDLTGEELTTCQSTYPVIEYAEVTDTWGVILDLAIIVIPVIVIIAFFAYMMRQAQSMNNQNLGFGKSKARLYGPDKRKVTFKDVAGNESAKQDLTEIVDFLKHSDKYVKLGAKMSVTLKNRLKNSVKPRLFAIKLQ